MFPCSIASHVSVGAGGTAGPVNNVGTTICGTACNGTSFGGWEYSGLGFC